MGKCESKIGENVKSYDKLNKISQVAYTGQATYSHAYNFAQLVSYG